MTAHDPDARPDRPLAQSAGQTAGLPGANSADPRTRMLSDDETDDTVAMGPDSGSTSGDQPAEGTAEDIGGTE